MGSRYGAPVGVWGQAPRSQMYTNSLQLSSALPRRFVIESVLHLLLPPPPKNYSDLHESRDPALTGQGYPTVATLYTVALYVVNSILPRKCDQNQFTILYILHTGTQTAKHKLIGGGNNILCVWSAKFYNLTTSSHFD